MAKKQPSKTKSADLIDQQLKLYRSMRDFRVTQEPSGIGKAAIQPKQLPFVIQKHAATRLHYDFRLGWNGVLKSWAIAKGPSYQTKDKRLAVQVEDHPIEYGGFEGIIPKGQYGGGTVMLWDKGTWEPQPGHADVNAGLRDGSLKFTLHGSKMKGNWALIRMNGRAAGKDKPNWLLIKEHDSYERGPDDPDILEEKPNSAVTGRSLEKIAESSDHIWASHYNNGEKPRQRESDATAQHSAVHVSAAKRSAAPARRRSAHRDIEVAHVSLTHPDKVLDAETGLTKQQLADYYWIVAEQMLPHITHRPLSLVRCPEGSTKPCFFQKHANSTLPSGIESVDVPDKKTGKPEPYITLSTAEALADLAQIEALEIHPWGSRNSDLTHPDRIVIDLDPDEAISWETLSESAAESRKLFKKLGLETFLKSTGGKGLHIVAPIVAEHDWAVIKNFAHIFAAILEKSNPELYLTKMSKAARKGRIFIDYLRNDWGATAVAPFSPRARAGMSVAMPLAWSELASATRPVFRVSEIASWRGRLTRNPWKKLLSMKQRLLPEKLEEFRRFRGA